MADQLPSLFVRDTLGVREVAPEAVDYSQCSSSSHDLARETRCIKFSHDGSLLAWCNCEGTKVANAATKEVLFQIPKTRVSQLSFSPCDNYLSTWEPYMTTQANVEGYHNMYIFDLKTKNQARSFIQKRKDGWEPTWSSDETACMRFVNNEIHVYKDEDFSTIGSKIYLQNVAMVSFSPTGPPHHVAIYVVGKKGAPSFVRLFRYPHLENSQTIANKSFYKCDKLEMFWNKKGTALLLLASTEVDASGSSYYGEQVLHYLSTSGDSSMVSFDKNGPVYCVDWNPNSKEFCAVYGYMPAKATIFNLKCDPVFHFGTGPRNICSYNSHGNILCLCGFGNLQGNVEFWGVKDKKLVNKMLVADTTLFEWCPDGCHFVTATTSPRLRVDNGFKIWHCDGRLIMTEKSLPNVELWEAAWQVCPSRVFKEPVVRTIAATSVPVVKAAAYKPPMAKGLRTLKLHEVEAPQSNQTQNLSAAALKNKKKRDAKSKAKSNEEAPLPSAQETSLKKAGEAATVQSPEENDKKIRALKKKIRQIEDLKAKQCEGKQLEANQLEKLNAEKSLLKELHELEQKK